MIWGRSSVWLERLPVTQEVASSSLVDPAKRKLFLTSFFSFKPIIIVGTAIISTKSSLKIPSSTKLLVPNSLATVLDNYFNSFNPTSATSLSLNHNKMSFEFIVPIPALVTAMNNT